MASGGSLHLVPVPIVDPARAHDGDACALRAIAPASVDATRGAHYFLVENARSARAFLKAIAHPQPIASLQIVEIGHQPDPALVDGWLAPLLGAGNRTPIDAVLLSEAGCPGIADPGASLVARAHRLGITVIPWVGPSSIILALMGAGMNGQQFRFLGYLPQERAALREALRGLQQDARRGETQVFIETPYRNARLFEAVLQTCDAELDLCLAIELTAPSQMLITRSIAQWRGLPAAQLPALDRRATVFLLHAAPAGPRGARRT